MYYDDYDNIISDDKDIEGFACKTFEVNNAHQHKEGYCYNPHYEIPIKYYSNIISTRKPISLTLTNIEAISNEEERKKLLNSLVAYLINNKE